MRSRWSRRTAVWACAVLAIAATVAFARFDTRDADGVRRSRTAAQVWSTVAPKLPPIGSTSITRGIYVGAVALTVPALLTLVWFALVPASGRTDVAPPAWRIREHLRASISAPRATGLSWFSAAGVLIALALLVAWRMGAFTLTVGPRGGFDTFVAVDHPFHVARAEALKEALTNHESLRWIAAHQGGYPTEFYPLGFAWFEVALWALMGGAAALPMVHSIAVTLVFVAPLAIYWTMARRDGRPATVALGAGVFHVAVPGGIWHGGYAELVSMGLVTNVAAAVLALAAFAAIVESLRGGARRAAPIASLLAGGALWTNPRSGIALLACGAGAWIAVVMRERGERLRLPAARLAAIAVLAGLAAAPEIASLVRFGDLFYFVRYTSYPDVWQYVGAAMEAVSLPLFALAVLGVVAAFLAERDHLVTRAAACALLVYAAATMLVSFTPLAAVFPQLESTRLMPVQRLLTMYVAATGLHVATRALFSSSRMEPWMVQASVIAVVGVIYLAPGFMPDDARSLAPVERGSEPAMIEFQRAIAIADQITAPDRAILVVGSGLSDHQQLWAPVVARRAFYYDDWMWYWHTRHAGPYDPRRAARYDRRRLAEIFTAAFLRRHGIGTLVVTGNARRTAARSADLEPLLESGFSLYTVRAPASIVTFGARRPESFSLQPHLIAATDAEGGGDDAIVRRNWHPRWHATVNGVPVAVARTADGYMRVPVPHGRVALRLEYALLPMDRLARGVALVSVAACLILMVRRRVPAEPCR